MYHNYSWLKIILRRTAALVIGLLALPVMLFRQDRARFYSWLHRYWSKTSNQPVWLAQSEAAGGAFW
ncbi:YbfA family protein [Pantoea sp. B65]|uniref:YbfA family protein n=1 Tax=Pantoea sp. B65 TaxID=2813359 RepID=UPI0039B54B01